MPVIPPPALALAAAVLQHVLAPGRAPDRGPDRGPARGPARGAGPARKLAAGTVAAASLGLLGASLAGFRRAGTTVEPFDPRRATALVTTGANGITRNPMYVGMAGLLSAHALLRGGVATLVPVAGFVAAIDRLQIRPEEAALAEMFGDEYAAYRRQVPRWLGPRAS